MSQNDAFADYQAKRERLETLHSDGKITDADKDAILAYVSSFDKADPSYEKPDSDKDHKKYTSLSSDLDSLTRVALVCELTADDSAAINARITALCEGHTEVRKQGYADSTRETMQNITRAFLRYHGEADPEDIEVDQTSKGSQYFTNSDMLTREEINNLLDAPDYPRDRAVIGMLLFTGLRNSALRWLRIGDLDLDKPNGTFELNLNCPALKGADELQGPRPLLTAEPYVRKYLDVHPHKDDPDAFLISRLPNAPYRDPYEEMTSQTLSRITREAAEKAGINKPANPHALRHNFVTISRLEHDINDSTLKYLIGHKEDSQVMETTYSHISAAKHVEKALEGYGIKEPEARAFTPDNCLQCQRPLPDHAQACEWCGKEYTHEAWLANEEADNRFWESKGEADTQKEEKGVDTVREIIDEDPEAKAAILEELKDELLDEVRADLD